MNTLKKVKMSNMISPRGNKEVPNQFIIKIEGQGTYFQSYKSIIAFIPFTPSDKHNIGTQAILDEKYWDFSTTTGKYRNQFLGEDIEETRKKIASGEYLLANLN